MIQPRYYQSEAVQSLYDYFGSGKDGNPLVLMPTGTGKSVVIADFVRSVIKQWPGQRVIIATHVKELVSQNHSKMLETWPEAPAGIHSAGLSQRDVIFPVIFGGIQSMVKNAAKFGHRDLLLVDEAHLISGKDTSNYGKFISILKAINPALKIIGFSATRLSQWNRYAFRWSDLY
jgi:DNA repair protein RadD